MAGEDDDIPYWVLISVLFSSVPLTAALAMSLHQVAFELYQSGDSEGAVGKDCKVGGDTPGGLIAQNCGVGGAVATETPFGIPYSFEFAGGTW